MNLKLTSTNTNIDRWLVKHTNFNTFPDFEFLKINKTRTEVPGSRSRCPAGQTSYKVKAHKEDAVKLGAKVLTGGKVKTGLVYEPTLLLIDDATKHAEAWTVETFGPIACVYVVDSFDAAIELANESEYGLSAGVLTNDLVKGMRAVREVRAGSVHIGMQSFQSDSLAPIGGYGMSGLGKSGGKYSMEHFTEQKWCSIELGETPVLPSFSIPA